MNKTVLSVIAFCAGFMGMLVGVVFIASGNGELVAVCGFVLLGFGIWGIKWSLTNGLTAISSFFKSQKDSGSK